VAAARGRDRVRGADDGRDAVSVTGRGVIVTAGALGRGDREGAVDVLCRDCAAGAGSGEGAGVVAGTFCGLGPAACAAVIGSAADTATTAAVRLIFVHRAMAHGNGRC
jgi:hypothetical protein